MITIKHRTCGIANNLPFVAKEESYSKYVSTAKAKDIFGTVCTVFGGMNLGASIGTVLGAVTAPGVGIIPGVIVGASLGAVASAVMVGADSYERYKKYRSTLSKEAIIKIDEAIAK